MPVKKCPACSLLVAESQDICDCGLPLTNAQATRETTSTRRLYICTPMEAVECIIVGGQKAKTESLVYVIRPDTVRDSAEIKKEIA